MFGKIKNCAALLLFGSVAFEAQAVVIPPNIYLQPNISNVSVGDVVTLDMYLDAEAVAGILAGGLDLFYDTSILSYNGDFAFDASFLTDPDLSRPGNSGGPDDCSAFLAVGCAGPGEINGIAFGDFNGGLGASGPTLVGSLSFTAVGASLTSQLTMADNDYPAGPWFNTAGNPLEGQYAMGYGVTIVSVSPSEVPVPAAVWLFGSGLLGLVGVARRRV